MAHFRIQSLCRLLACKSAWCTILMASVCGVLAYHQSWRACVVSAVVMFIILLAVNEDLNEFETEASSGA